MKRSLIPGTLFVLALTGVVWAQTASPLQPSEAAPHEKAASPSDVALGEPLEGNAPKYPKQALKAKVQGAVRLRLNVNENGEVTSAAVLSGNPELADAAIQAVKKWRYLPYYADSHSVAATTVVSLLFKIDDKGKSEIQVAFQPRPLGQVFKVGNGVTPPKAIYAPNPPYSEGAREARLEGTCVLKLVVGPDGRPYNIQVSRTLDKELDEQAIRAVRQWKFEPATKDGKPVAVYVTIEIAFHIHS